VLQVVTAARKLLDAGVSSVLVTLSERGAVLVQAGGAVTRQPALPVPGGTVVDGTAAGETALSARAGVLSFQCWVLSSSLHLPFSSSQLERGGTQSCQGVPQQVSVVCSRCLPAAQLFELKT
jgi:fructose-1-phosphate kinase PfkB-like protein